MHMAVCRAVFAKAEGWYVEHKAGINPPLIRMSQLDTGPSFQIDIRVCSEAVVRNLHPHPLLCGFELYI